MGGNNPLAKHKMRLLKSMFTLGPVYFENSGAKWSKLGIFVDKHHKLHVIDLIFG